MKTLKLILSNLILVLTLVILTSGTVFADTVAERYSFEIVADTDANGKINAYNLKIYEHAPESGAYSAEKKEEINIEDFEEFDIYFSGKKAMYYDFSLNIYKDDDNIVFEDSRDGKIKGTYNNKTFKITAEEGFFEEKQVTMIEISLNYLKKEGESDYEMEPLLIDVNYSTKEVPKIDFKINYSSYSKSFTLEISAKHYKEMYEYSNSIQLSKGNKQSLTEIFNDAIFWTIGATYKYSGFDNSVEEVLLNSQGEEILLIASNKTVLGSTTLPVLFEVNNLTEGANKQFDFVKQGTNEGISMEYLKELWAKTIEIKNENTGKIYKYDIENGRFDDSSGVELNGNIFKIKDEGGKYTVTVMTKTYTTIYSKTFYTIDETKFDVRLEQIPESVDYQFVFSDTIGNLQKVNGGVKFYIYIYDSETKEEIGKTDSVERTWGFLGQNNKNENFIKVPKDSKLFTYDKIIVRFYCSDTGLDKLVELDVPELTQIEEMYASIVESGKVSVFNASDNKEMTLTEIYAALGYTDNNNTQNINLIYKTKGTHLLGSFAARIFGLKDKILEFDGSELPYIVNIEEITAENALQIYNDYKNIFSYYKNILAGGPDSDKLYLQAKTSDGALKEIEINRPENGSNYPWFEAITGISFEECGKIVEALEKRLTESGVLNFISPEDMTITITETEEYKDFVLPSNGLYYVYEETETGVYHVKPNIYIANDHQDKPILLGGRFIGKVDRGYQLGEYVYYDPNGGSIKWGAEEEKANCYPLIGGMSYRFYNFYNKQNITLKFVRLDINGDESDYELVEILDETSENTIYRNFQSDYPGHEIVGVGYILNEEGASLFEMLERLISKCVRGLANGLNYLVQMSLQSISGEPTASTVDIDSIIFNHYPDTSINFFSSNKSVLGSENMKVEEPSKMIKMFRDGINDWYNKFVAIAIAGYIVILLYIGVKILLGSTGKNKSQFKELLLAWGTGLILLFFFPYVIKFSIALNNSLVGMIEESKSGALKITSPNNVINMSGFTLPTIADADDYGAVASQMDVIPYADSDTSYMAEMARRAEKSKSLVDAFVYLIMVFQFVMIVIMYYKRVFIIAFLIALFPFVALAYAVDKIIDDKAQAFSVWCRELMVNIFIQSIHALIYVFVMGAVYAGGEYSGDWLLAIIGITFLFKGEQILKKIIGQEGSTVKSLKETATRTVATVVAARTVTKNIKDNYIGRDSHLGRAFTAHRQYRTEKKIAKAMGVLATPPNLMPIAPQGNTLGTYNPALVGDTEYNDLADAIQVVNNRNQVTDPQKLGQALDKVLANRNSKDLNIQNLMKGLNLSDDQLRALDKAQKSLVDEAIDAKKGNAKDYATRKQKIDADLELRLQVIFPESKEKRDLMKRAMYYTLRDGDRERKHRPRALSRREVADEYTKAKNRRKEFYFPAHVERQAGITNPFSEAAKPTALSTSATRTKNRVLSYYNGNATEKDKKFAESVAILKDFSNLNQAKSKDVTKYTSKQVMEAANYIAEHEADSNSNKAAVSEVLGIGAEEVRSIVSEEVCRQYTDLSQNRHRNNFRSDMKRGARTPKIQNGTQMEKAIATRHIKESWEMAKANIEASDKEVRNGVCSLESLNKVNVKEVLKKEREAGYSEATLIDKIIEERDHENYNEIIMIEDFAREQLEDLPEYSNATTYDGLTQREHEQKANDLKKKYREELARTGATTLGVVLGASVGAGLAIGLSDEKSALEEGLIGASGGALAGDAMAESIMGRETTKQKVKILNPYTGQIDEFELKTRGATSEVRGRIDENEVLTVDDYRLNVESLRYDLDIKLLEKKRQYEREQQVERRRAIYDEALRSKNPTILDSNSQTNTNNPRRLNVPNNTNTSNNSNP